MTLSATLTLKHQSVTEGTEEYLYYVQADSVGVLYDRMVQSAYQAVQNLEEKFSSQPSKRKDFWEAWIVAPTLFNGVKGLQTVTSVTSVFVPEDILIAAVRRRNDEVLHFLSYIRSESYQYTKEQADLVHSFHPIKKLTTARFHDSSEQLMSYGFTGVELERLLEKLHLGS